MDQKAVTEFFNSNYTLSHYESAARKIGLWDSEEKIFSKIFKLEDSILELGCGAGRITIGMHELGYKNILGTDIANNMVTKARHLSKVLGYSIPFRVCDARKLEFEDSIFEGAIFGFNGLMQIPKYKFRFQALKEIHRILKKDGLFVFTSHLRSDERKAKFWKKESEIWSNNKQNPLLDDFGDKFYKCDHGEMFIHVPTKESLESMIYQIGFKVEVIVKRSMISNESQEVREFSDDCFFWILRK